MAKLTRKELKSDRFQLEVQHGVTFVAHHQRQLIRWGGVAAAVLIVGFGIYFYTSHEATVRGEALHQALLINNAPVGAPANEYQIGFPTQAEHDKAAEKAFKDLAAKYPGTQEALIAEYYLGISAADQGNSADAEKRFKTVMRFRQAGPGLVGKTLAGAGLRSRGQDGGGGKPVARVDEQSDGVGIEGDRHLHACSSAPENQAR